MPFKPFLTLLSLQTSLLYIFLETLFLIDIPSMNLLL